MCEYCKTGKRIEDVDDRDIDNGAYVFVDDDDNELSVVLEQTDYVGRDIDSLYINVPINYCPMCGRKLGD